MAGFDELKDPALRDLWAINKKGKFLMAMIAQSSPPSFSKQTAKLYPKEQTRVVAESKILS
jgi:hypothetical protein